MSALPTEEDVLAVLLLRACAPVVTNRDDSAQWDNEVAWARATSMAWPRWLGEMVQVRLSAFGSFEAAIADAERKWEIEQAEREVISAAERWWPAQHVPFADQRRLVSAITRLREVRRRGR